MSLGPEVDQFFLIVMGSVVYLMQMGFAFLEAGGVRSKNVANILMKNILDSAIGALCYWLMGYAFAYGDDGNGFIGYKNFLLIDLDDSKNAFWFFQYVFAATAATIVSGAMAERTNFIAYVIYSVVLTAVVYPIVSHWIWDARGWLAAEGPWDGISFMDFAGSTVVHCVGGLAALIGAIALGPRKGFKTEKNEKAIRGHSVPLACLGGFILFFGFFAFNGGSQLSISNTGDGAAVGRAVRNTVLGGLTAGLVAIILDFIVRDKKFSLLLCINANLTGMVAMCASCNVIDSWAAVVIGMMAGPVFVGSSKAIFVLGIDDPLDAVSVHLGGGILGTLAAPLFNSDVGVLYNWDGTAFKYLLWNIIGLFVVLLWVALFCVPMFVAMRVLGILRVSEDVEESGLDIESQGERAYPPDAYSKDVALF